MPKTKFKKIKTEDLKDSDVGRWIIYHSSHEEKYGRIKSWNDEWIFVVYHCAGEWGNYQEYTAAATNPNDLEFK